MYTIGYSSFVKVVNVSELSKYLKNGWKIIYQIS